MTEDEIEAIFRTADALRNGYDCESGDSNTCNNCHQHVSFVLCYSEGHRVCDQCGAVQSESIFDSGDCNFVKVYSNYKRIHHFHERISQLLLMESPIPDEDWEEIRQAIKESNFKELNKTNIRQVLRSLNMQIYIEKWLQIMYRYTGIRPPQPGVNMLHKLDAMFIAIQGPFSNHKQSHRRNFLNYNFVFNRLFQLLGVEQYCMFFPMIKSKCKLRQLDTTWRHICKELDWEYLPLNPVNAFSIQLDTS